MIAVIAIAVGLSAMGRPEMSNDNAEFAPDDPAITAAERIESLFGSDAAVTPLQFVFVADSGDVITAAGLEAATSVAAAIEATELDGVRLADYLVTQPGSGPITSTTPVQLAVAERGTRSHHGRRGQGPLQHGPVPGSRRPIAAPGAAPRG